MREIDEDQFWFGLKFEMEDINMLHTAHEIHKNDIENVYNQIIVYKM